MTTGMEINVGTNIGHQYVIICQPEIVEQETDGRFLTVKNMCDIYIYCTIVYRL